jgi:competence protein ComEC
MKHPLVAVVVAYGTGLLLAHFFQPSSSALVLILFLIVILLLALTLKKQRKLLIWLLLALAGWANLTARTIVHSPADLRVLLGNTEPVAVAVTGTLAETPRLKIIEDHGQEIWRSVALVRVKELAQTADFQPATGEILAATPGVLGPDFFAGQPVEISGVISRPAPPLAEGLFDFRSYLATRGVYYELKTDDPSQWALLDPHAATPPLTDRFLAWSQRTLALGLPVEDEPLRLLWAMTLGWRTAFTGDISDPFLQAGTMHMFAINEATLRMFSVSC